MRCLTCGRTTTRSGTRCSSCRRQLVDAPVSDAIEQALRQLAVDDLRRSADTMHRSSGSLAMFHGPLAGLRLELNRDVLRAGRAPENDIFLDDVSVSRHHAELRGKDGDLLIVDLGSVNGTYVNDIRIHEVPLRDEDEVQIGRFKLVFFAGGR